MKLSYRVYAVTVALFAVISFNSSAALAQLAPPVKPHPHNPDTILWEWDAIEDGSSEHNHMNDDDFGGLDMRSNQPYSAQGCWNNHTHYFDSFLAFSEGHCFVDAINPLNIVTYYFADSDLPSGAKARIRDAFDEVNGLITPLTTVGTHGVAGNEIGVLFVETPFFADINVYWDPMPGAFGSFNGITQQLKFDSGIDWDFAAAGATLDNEKNHFLTTALHEVGHAAGLSHQNDHGDMMSDFQGNGAPGPAGTRLLFFEIDGHSAQGIYELYGQSIAQPPPPCEMFVTWLCESNQPRAVVTPTLAGFGMANIDLDYQPFGSSDWFSIYNGAPTCPIYHPPSNLFSSTVRALVTTTVAGYITGCSVTVVPPSCHDDPGGGL